jgi:hypothetical protein
MNFCNIVLSLMTLLVALMFVLKYAGTSLVVMFLHQYHTCCNMTIGFKKTS